MSFVSLQFACFVIILLLVYYLVPARFRYIVLLTASLFFYLITGVKNFAFIVVTALTTYFGAILMDNISKESKDYISAHKSELSREDKKQLKDKTKTRKKRILATVVIINVGILFFLKYVNLGIAYFNMYRLEWTGNTDFVPFLDVILPLGISFYTFQTLGYLIDVYYDRCTASRSIFKYMLYVSFFPQIIQGPISRFNDLMPELEKPVVFDFYNIKRGFYRIMFGLFKKLVIADRVAPYVKTSMDFAQYYKGPYILLGIFFYAFQIYGDFSGGIDITIGVANMLGIDVAENFERPFFSKSISEYWRRWHITLGTWFKDYIFYPLSINKTILRFAKWVREHIGEGLGKRIPIYLPMIAVWALTGMWHGSEMRYVVWGLLNCVFIILGTETEGLSARIMSRLKLNEGMFVVKSYRIVKTFWLMSFLRLFDINKDVDTAIDAFKGVFTGWSMFSIDKFEEWFAYKPIDVLIALVAIFVLFGISMIQRKGSIRERVFKLPVPMQWTILSLLIAVVVLFGAYGLGYDASSFVYMQF